MPRPKQFNEEEVLTKAMELFWEKGFHATSMQDLVCNLGINRASLYDTFGSKETLFNKSFALYRNSSSTYLHDLFNNAPSVKAAFRQLFDKIIEDQINDVTRKGCFIVNTITELLPKEKKLATQINLHVAHVISIFETYIQKGIDSGEICTTKNAKQLALFIFTSYNGIQVISKVNTPVIELDLIANTALSTLD